MKKSVFSFFNVILISVFFFISCASAPKAEEQLPEEVLEDVNAVEDVIEEVTTVDNSSALEQADLARQAAIDANADKVAPIQFAATDALLKTLQAQAETGVDVSIGLKDVQTRYEALEKYAKAMDAKARVDELGFASYDQASYDKGTQAIADLQNLFSETNILSSAMLEKANEAYSSFNSVLIGAFKKLAKEERNGAFAAKKDADSVKAAVAEKDSYGKAVEDLMKTIRGSVLTDTTTYWSSTQYDKAIAWTCYMHSKYSDISTTVKNNDSGETRPFTTVKQQ